MEEEQRIREEVAVWKHKIQGRSGLFNRLAKKAQNKFNQVIPEKAHAVITEGIKGMVSATLFGSDFLTKPLAEKPQSLAEKEKLVKERFESYRKTAVLEGAGTGAGGILLGLADFPLLLSIKMKFLFEAASIHGYDVKAYEERIFMLQVFQLAFSSDQHRKTVLHTIENWETSKETLKEIDWRTFQQEYRDYLDIMKMLQLIPGIGAVIGAYANFQLMDQLEETAVNAFRIRWLQEKTID